MEYVISGIVKAVQLILSADPDLIDIALRSLRVSGIATLMAALWGLPVGVAIGLFNFFGRNVIRGIFNAFLGVPTVILGLLLYLLLAPAAPFGFLGLIYTEMGISLGQAILVTPIIITLTAASVELVEREVRELATTLGATKIEASLAVIKEALAGVVLALIASFNRAIAELGIAIMIGGNVFVRDSALNTRVLTTAIQMYTARGEIDMAIALGIILLSIVLVVSVASGIIQGRVGRG